MNNELQSLVDQFLNILHLYSVINRKPRDYGTGDLLFFSELHTIIMIGKNKEINMTGLADLMGVTRGAISQTVTKLLSKGLIVKANTTNRKEINLRLSDKGLMALKGQESFQMEIFRFAESLYEMATPHDRQTVKRLFTAISANMQDRVKNL